MMPGYTTLPLRAGDCAFCPTLKADSSRSVYLRAGVAPRVGSVEPEPADSEKAEEEERPEHEPCHPLDKVWLPTYPEENTQDALHTWCTDTGIFRNQGGEEARPRGFWVTVLYRLQRRLEKESRKTGMTAQLTEPQAKLILHELDALDGYYDRWWRTESSQVTEFVRVVQKWRPDISEQLVVDTVKRTW